MAKRKPNSEPETDSQISLESAMTELSQIVSRLESGQETLDESLAQFERGMGLLRICHRQLDVAAQRIEIVTQMSPEGSVSTEDFDATSTLHRSTAADATRSSRKAGKAEDADEEGLLF